MVWRGFERLAFSIIGNKSTTDVPVVPTTESVDWYQYNDKSLTGWPTQEDPFSRAAAFAVPDIEQVLLHLHLK